MSPEEIVKLAKEVIQKEISGIDGLVEQIGKEFAEAVDLIMKCKGHLLVTGVGTSHYIAGRLAHILSCCGTPALFIHPGDSQHGQSGAVRPEDVIIAISKGGETQEVNHLVNIARDRKAKIVAICENPDSTLGRMSDVVLKVKSSPEIDTHGIIATGSSLMHAAVGDALCAVLFKIRGYSIKEFGKTHPGGAVGKKLKDMGSGGK